jgi:tetratricopeptide (TPR) repeat protein
MLWPVRPDPARAGVLHVGPPRVLASTCDSGADASRDGRIRVFPLGDRTLVLDRDRPGWRVELGPQHDVRHCAVSPDGRWVATCSWWEDVADVHAKSVRIWEAETGRHVLDLPLEGNSYANFSPDGRWLATRTNGYVSQLWAVETWRAGRRFLNTSSRPGSWSPDGRLLAVSDTPGVIRLVETDDGKEVIRLTGPESRPYIPDCLSPDGTQLIAISYELGSLLVWDLRRIREQLKDLDMDWDWPEFPPAGDTAGSSGPVAVELEPGILRERFFKDDRHALAAFSVLLALQPLNPEAYLQRGLAHARLNDAARAVADYESFLRLAPADDRRRPEIHLRRASNYLQNLKDDRRALAALLDAADAPAALIPWPGRYALLCNNLAWKAAKPSGAGVPEAMLRLARKAVEIEPYYFMYQNTLGVVLYRLGRYEEAIRCLEPNLQKSRQYVAFDLYFLSMSHARQGQPALARTYFDRATAAQAETRLSPSHRQELTDFRAEAETVLGLTQGQ